MTTISVPNDQLLSFEEVVARLGVSAKTVQRLRDELPRPVRIARRCVRWRASEIDRYISELTPHTPH